jgi:hypothetical protein
MDWLLLAVLAVGGLTAATLVLILFQAPTVDTLASTVDEDPAALPLLPGKGSDESRGEEQRDNLDVGRQPSPVDDR